MDPSHNAHSEQEHSEQEHNEQAPRDTAQDELAYLMHFINSNLGNQPLRTPPPQSLANIFSLPDGGESLLMPLAVQGLASLLDSTQENSGIMDRFALALNYGRTPYKNVLSEAGSELLHTVSYGSISETAPNKECPIFQTEFNESTLVTQLPCKHCFEPEAIKQWLTEKKAECPVCRMELPSKEVREEESDEELEQTNVVQSTNTQLPNREFNQEEEDLRLALLASLDEFNQ